MAKDLMDVHWEWVITMAKSGDRAPLVTELRRKKSAIPTAARKEIAAFIDDPKSWKKRSGRPSKAKRVAWMVPLLYSALMKRNPKLTPNSAHSLLAKRLKLSKGVVEDIMMQRKTFRKT